jgi:hypothetical protein
MGFKIIMVVVKAFKEKKKIGWGEIQIEYINCCHVPWTKPWKFTISFDFLHLHKWRPKPK